MIAGPAAAVQRGIYSALTQSADVLSALGTAGPPRIWDEVKEPQPTFPYIVVGDDQVLDDSHCEAAFEVISTLHVFSRKRGAGKTQAKAIGDAIIAALGDGEISVANFVSITSEFETALQSANYFYEPDGKTAHGVLVFRFLLDQA